jgi:hypothetical protein
LRNARLGGRTLCGWGQGTETVGKRRFGAGLEAYALEGVGRPPDKSGSARCKCSTGVAGAGGCISPLTWPQGPVWRDELWRGLRHWKELDKENDATRTLYLGCWYPPTPVVPRKQLFLSAMWQWLTHQVFKILPVTNQPSVPIAPGGHVDPCGLWMAKVERCARKKA